MPANKTYRQGVGKQRHHKHRVGRMLVPHGRVSGLLFTVNPRQESRALRELQLYLHPLIADLEKAEAEEEKAKGGLPQGSGGNQPTPTGNEEVEKAAAPSTSSLLAAELAAYVPARPGQRKETKTTAREGDCDSPNASDDGEDCEGGAPIPARKRQRPDDDDNDAATRRAKANCRRWLAPLETGCKGHMMVSIPFPPQMETTAEEKATATGAAEPSTGAQEATETPAPHDGAPGSGNDDDDDNENTVAPPPAEEGSTPPHSIQLNPLVQTVVGRIFKDVEENPRPLLRHCFRLMPCELTCCPTLPEMRLALERLIGAHFPPEISVEGGLPPRLHRVSLSFKVKNNTNVEGKKAYLHAALEATFPANRFVVIPAARISNSGGGVSAMFCVFVAHATCAMGVQKQYSEREEYNLHAIGAKHLELSSSV